MIGSVLVVVALLAAETPTVKVENRPASDTVVREMTGDYNQHAAAARELLSLISARCSGKGVVSGEYPQDPDAVPATALHWRIGYSLQAGGRCANTALVVPYARQRRAAEQVAVIDTTLAQAPKVGLSLFRWLADSGYAQVAPTRMEYLGDGSPDSSVRIVMPVRRRAWVKP